MGSLRQRGEVWWIRYSRAGNRYEESSGSTKRSDASTLLRLREGDAAKGIPVTPRVGRILFEEAAADFLREYETNRRKSLALARIHVEHLRGYFAGCRMANVTTADTRSYTARRQAQGIANGTINRELSALKRMFTLLVHSGELMVRPHIPLLKEAPPRSGFFEREQFEVMRCRLPEELRGMVTFAFITGWRIRSEVQVLSWRQVNFDEGTVRLDPGASKTGEPRVFPMTEELRQLLEAQRQYVQEIEHRLGGVVPRVFSWADGSPIKDFRGSWKAACRGAGCPARVPHDFRRSAIRNMVQRGVPERVAMQLAGHKTRTVFDRYAIVSSGDLSVAVTKLEGVASASSNGAVRMRRGAGTIGGQAPAKYPRGQRT